MSDAVSLDDPRDALIREQAQCQGTSGTGSGALSLAATAPSLAWLAGALVLAGLLESGVQLTRSLSLREALPPSAHAAGYSVMYAATGVGYAASATLAGVDRAQPRPRPPSSPGPG